MKWALNRRAIRPLIPVCLLALLLIFISSNSAFTQTSGSFTRIKDVPNILPEPNIEYADPMDDPYGRVDYVSNAVPHDPVRRDDSEKITINYMMSPINYYYWLFGRFPLSSQWTLEF